MPRSVAGYLIEAPLSEGASAVVYRARKGTDAPVILKLLRDEHPPPSTVAWFQREFERTRALGDVEGAIGARELVQDQHRWVMVLEDIGGQSLNLLAKRRRFTIEELIDYAIRVAETLGALHRLNVIHKDVTPANIVLNPASGELRLIDFGISTTLERESASPLEPGRLEGTLAYMSPEQTGRMNRAVDYRADYYGLGATLFELLTGEPPFATTDPLELIHCHIARPAPSASERRHDIPQALADVLAKLLAKNAEDRYRSTRALIADLRICADRLRAGEKAFSFPIAQHDVSDRFEIPQRLYGRDDDIRTLLGAFERVRHGGNELLLVAGYSGVGKSVLVHEIYKPLARERGFFISGKFDQLGRNVPYAPFIVAFRTLIAQLLTRSETDIAAWREQLLTACGANIQVLIELIPELELIVGEQPELSRVDGLEAQNRFNLTVRRFVAVLARPEHPLALFLDDLQWADGASLRLLESLVTATDIPALFLIGAYRDNETSPAHPLMLTLETVEQASAHVEQITLAPLARADVARLVADALDRPEADVGDLAELVLTRTGGNPFFINEFLGALHDDGLFRFDHEQGRWAWELDRVRAHEATGDVVDLMVTKLRRLAPKTRRLLELAACIGNRFDLETLAIVGNVSPHQAAADIWQGIEEGLVLPLSGAYKVMDCSAPHLAAELHIEYKFAHDRVQQAAYSLISDEERQPVHLRVGELLLQGTTEEERDRRLFDIVNQLNLGADSIASRDQRLALARLDLDAGLKAKASIAFDSVLEYCRYGLTALEHLEPGATTEPWVADRELASKLTMLAAEAAYFIADYELMDWYCDAIIERAEARLEQVAAREIRILAYSARDQLGDGLAVGLDLLDLLGSHIPRDAGQDHIGAAMAETLTLLAGRDARSLVDLPRITDAEKEAAMRISVRLFIPAFNSSPNVFALLVVEIVKLSLRHGNSPHSARGYVAFGLSLCGVVGDIETGYRFGQLALDLVERYQAREAEASTLFMFGVFIAHWKEPLEATCDLMARAYRSALENGDLEYAALAAFGYVFQGFWSGRELGRLEVDAESYGDAIAGMKQERQLSLNRLFHQVIRNLRGPCEEPTRIAGDIYDEDVVRPLLLETNTINELCYLELNKALLCYLFRNIDAAREHIERAEPLLPAVIATTAVATFRFYDSLIHLARAGDMVEEERSQVVARVAGNQSALAVWAEGAPMNYRHKHRLVAAELARVSGDVATARELYDEAIVLAHEHDFLAEEALACELAGRMYLDLGRQHVARHYLSDARYVYGRWGAEAKVADLVHKLPHLLAASPATPATDVPGTTATTATAPAAMTTSPGRGAPDLDLVSVIKASQAIAGEILLDRLLRKLMAIVIENAGAERGYLLLDKDGQWVIQAEGQVDSDAVEVLGAIPLDPAAGERRRVPAAVVNYVTRTRESVVLDDAAASEQFSRDPYIAENKPRSVVCTPLLKQGELCGVLYLENNLTIGAFTPERLRVVNILSSQAAVSIENAGLYSNIIALNAAYERFVPHEFLEFVGKESIVDVELGDCIHMDLTILFLDIRGFTALSDGMTPKENFEFINNYLSVTGPILRQHGGFIGKYTGDGMMGLFPTNPDRAVEAAVAILRRLEEFNRGRQAAGEPPITVGIGLNSGWVMLGTIGEANRMQGDAMSTAVNLAARIEGLTKKYGVSLLMTGATHDALGHKDRFSTRMLDRVQVQGNSSAVTVFEVFDCDPPEVAAQKADTAADYARGWSHYEEGDFTPALAAFESILGRNPSDGAAAVLAERIRHYQKHGAPSGFAGTKEWAEK